MLDSAMAIVAMTFIAVLALVVGVYWAFIGRQGAGEQRALQKRLQTADVKKRAKIAMSAAELGERGGPAMLRNAQSLINQSGLKLAVPAFFFLCWMVSFLVGLIVWMGTGRISLVGVGAGIGLMTPYWFVRWKASSRMWKFEEQFPEAIDLIARALRAGHAFPTGLSMVADELGPPVGPEFKLLYDRQNYGMPLPDALRSFAARVPVLDARFFVTAVLTQREAGGNLSGVLDNLAAVIRERFKVKRQVKVVSAHGRMTAVILMLLPPFVVFAQAFIAPDNLKLMLDDDLGNKMLIGAGVMQAIGMFAINKIVQIEY
jgi:tight adherence protein B